MWRVLLFVLVSACVVFADETKTNRQAEIKKLEEEIQIHQARARYAEREALRLMPLDFLDYRRYLIMQQKNEQEVERLKKQLDQLQTN